MNKENILIQNPGIQKKINSSLNHEIWPLENFLMIVVNDKSGKFLDDDLKIFAFNRFYLADHDLNSENAVTFIRHENVNFANSIISDFDETPTSTKNIDQKSIGTCCKKHSKPLKDIDFRFNQDFLENVEEVECKTLSNKVFMEKFVLTKTPVKLKRCFYERSIQLAEIFPAEEGNAGDKTLWTDIKHNILNNNGTYQISMIKARLSSNQSSILDTLYLFPEMDKYTKDFVNHNNSTEFNFYSMGMGQVLEKNITDQFYYLHKGSQWLTIIPPTRISQVIKKNIEYTYLFKTEIIMIFPSFS